MLTDRSEVPKAKNLSDEKVEMHKIVLTVMT